MSDGMSLRWVCRETGYAHAVRFERQKKPTHSVSLYKTPILKRCLLPTVASERSRDFFRQFDTKIYTIGHRVTENMLGILSSRVLREEPQNTGGAISLYGFLATI